MLNYTENQEDVFGDSPWIKSGLIGLILIHQTFAFTLCPMIIWYEKYGEDPLKRTILNQTFSRACLVIILMNLIPSNFILARLVSGSPFNYQFTYVCCFLVKSTVSIVGLLIIFEHCFFRFLTICIWKRLPPIDDLFFGTFLDLTNVTLGAFFSGIQNFSQVSPDYLVHFLTGQHEDTSRPAIRLLS